MTAPARTAGLLDTERLWLRGFTDCETDAWRLFELDSDPEVLRFVGPSGLSVVEAYRERIRTFWLPYYTAHPARGFWGLFEKATDEFLGWVFVRPATDYRFAAEVGWTRATDLELGYRLRRSAWGRGFATEAAGAVVRLTLADPAVTGIVAVALVPNRGSTRVMEKVGMIRNREFVVPGYDSPFVTYAIGRDGPTPS